MELYFQEFSYVDLVNYTVRQLRVSFANVFATFLSRTAAAQWVSVKFFYLLLSFYSTKNYFTFQPRAKHSFHVPLYFVIIFIQEAGSTFINEYGTNITCIPLNTL